MDNISHKREHEVTTIQLLVYINSEGRWGRASGGGAGWGGRWKNGRRDEERAGDISIKRVRDGQRERQT